MHVAAARAGFGGVCLVDNEYCRAVFTRLVEEELSKTILRQCVELRDCVLGNLVLPLAIAVSLRSHTLHVELWHENDLVCIGKPESKFVMQLVDEVADPELVPPGDLLHVAVFAMRDAESSHSDSHRMEFVGDLPQNSPSSLTPLECCTSGIKCRSECPHSWVY